MIKNTKLQIVSNRATWLRRAPTNRRECKGVKVGNEGSSSGIVDHPTKIGIYKIPVRLIKQPVQSDRGDQDVRYRLIPPTCSGVTASHQPPETPRRGSDDCNSGRLDAGVVLRLHDGSKVLRSPPWDLHSCKAADEIAFSLSLSLSLSGLLMLRLRELPVGSRLVGLYWPTSARFMRLLCPANAVIMSSPALFPPASRLYFHLLIFVLTSDRFVPRTIPISAAPRYGNSRRSLNS